MHSQLKKYGAPHTLVPIRLDAPEESKEKIRWLHEKFGFTCFCPDGLSKGYRAEGYPSREAYLEEAKKFAEVREYAASMDCSCGWFCNLTIKCGPGFTPIVRGDGTPHPFANCPLDESFAQTLSRDIAAFAAVARPAFIYLEDDFSISAANGCFCAHHLAAFEKRQGRRYEREELLEIFKKDTPEALALHRDFQALKKETLVSLAKRIRAEVDALCPEIPIGIMQSGASDRDGDFTEAVARALAGPHHTPFTRLYGTFYCGFESKKLPKTMHHPLYFAQHLPEDILCYHESDTYPHTRFFTSAKQMKAMLSAAYSYGMIGSIYFAQQYFDRPFEEEAFGKLYAAERARLAAVSRLAAECRPVGVEIGYNSFYYMQQTPYFAECIGRFGIPFATTDASVATLDARQAKYADHEAIMHYLKKGLLMDGEAAKILCERGYGEYLGVRVGADILESRPSLLYDLGAREVIAEEFAEEGEGREMWCAHAFCPIGNGKWMQMEKTNAATRTVTEGVDFRGNVLMPTMTYFENALGGRICVMSLTVKDNPSQALYNYRRQRILQRMICKMSDEYPIVENAPDMYAIALSPKNESSELLGMLTLINLSEDDAEGVHIRLPEKLLQAKGFYTLDREGNETLLPTEKTARGIRLLAPLCHLEPTYILMKK